MPFLRSLLLSVCSPALINQTQGTVMMSPRPTGRARQPVTQISICEVSEVSLSQIKKLHTHEGFFFHSIKVFFLFCRPLSRWAVESLLINRDRNVSVVRAAL